MIQFLFQNQLKYQLTIKILKFQLGIYQYWQDTMQQIVRLNNKSNFSGLTSSIVDPGKSYLFSEPIPANLLKKDQVYPKQIQINFGEPESFELNLQAQNYEKKTVDLSNLKTLVEKAIKASSKTSEKNTVFLIGKTGSGKSTLIHLLAGINLEAKERHIISKKTLMLEKKQYQKVSSEGQQNNEGIKDLVLVPQKQLIQFQIGHQKASKTKLINLFEKDGLILVDTPGLQDSDGESYDISNSIGLQNAFSKAKNVKFLLVISQNLIIEGRGNDMRDLLSEFIGFIPNVPLNQLLPSISVIISHSKYDKQSVINNLQAIAQKKIQGLDYKAEAILLEMSKQLKRRKSSGLNFVQMGTLKNMVDGFFSKQLFEKLKDCKGISNEVGFKISIKPGPMKYVLGKMDQYKNIIHYYAKQKQFNLVKQQVDGLDFLRKYIKSQQVDKKYNECMTIIQETISKLFSQFQNNLDSFMSLREEGNKKLKEICKNIQNIKKSEILKKQINISPPEDKNISDCMLTKIRKEISYIKQNIEDYKLTSTLISKLQRLYLKLGKQIKGIKELYEIFSKQLTNIFSLNINKIVNAIYEGDYKSIILPWQMLASLLNVFKTNFQKDFFSTEEALRNFFIQSVTFRFKSSICPILKVLTEEQVENLNEEYKKYEDIIKNDEFQKIIGKKSLEILHEDMKKQIIDFFNQMRKNIQIQDFQKKQQELKNQLRVINKINQKNRQLSLLADKKQYDLIAEKFKHQISNDKKIKELLQIIVKMKNFNEINDRIIYEFKQRMIMLRDFQILTQNNKRYPLSYISNIQLLSSCFEKENSQLRDKILIQLQKKNNEGKDFELINKINTVMKKINELNQEQLQKQFKKRKLIMNEIIQQRISKIEELIKNKSFKEWSQISRNLKNLNDMKKISQDQNLDKIRNFIQQFYQKASNEITNGQDCIRSTVIETYSEDFVQSANNIFNLFKILEFCSEIFGDLQNHHINESKAHIIIIINEKFEAFSSKIEGIMKKNAKSAQKYIQVLERYKKQEFSQEIKNQLKNQYNNLNKKYENKEQQQNIFMKIISGSIVVAIIIIILLYLNNQFASFEDIAKQIQESFELRNYKKVFMGLDSLERFEGTPNIIGSIYGSPLQFKEKTIKNINIQQEQLLKSVLSEFNKGVFGSFENLKNLIKLLVASKAKLSTGKLDGFHQEAKKYFKSKIPQFDVDPGLDKQYEKLVALQNQNGLIQIFKGYIEEMNAEVFQKNVKDVEFKKYIQQMAIGRNFLVEIKKNLTLLNEQFKKLWSDKKINEIQKKLSQVKFISNQPSSKFKNSYSDLQRSISDIIENQVNLTLKDLGNNKYQKLDQRINYLELVDQKLRSIGTPFFDKIKEQLNKKVLKIQKKALTAIKNKQRENIVNQIINLKRLQLKISSLTPKITESMKKILKKVSDSKLIGQIHGLLENLANKKQQKQQNNDQLILSRFILSDYSNQLSIPRIFPNITLSFQDAISRFILNGSIDNSYLSYQAEIYNHSYESQKMKYIAKGNKNKIDQNLKQIRKNIDNYIKNDQQICQKIPKIIANVFVYWSLKKSGFQFYSHLKQNHLLQPHPIQVLSILAFFGCHNETKQKTNLKAVPRTVALKNHVMQISTGQGKSVILGVMSILFALMQYKVDCISYSQYLSERDYEDFKEIFKGLGVDKFISYGTINQITEKLINQGGNVRELTSRLFMPSKNGLGSPIQDQDKRVLLFDEVDVFFSKDFYGETYNPMTLLQNNQINSIIDYIWKHRSQVQHNIKIAYKGLNEYKKLSQDYKDSINLIEKQFQLMIRDAKSFDSLEYIIQNGTVGYKELDGVSFTNVYGYKTMFTYIYESQLPKPKITLSKANQKKGIILTCGRFSYAEMISKFNKILGVTGTLQSLSHFEQKILKQYNISQKTYAPSVYGSSRKIQRPIKIQKDKQLQFQTIANIISTDINNQGAVLVFFENQKQLKQFQQAYQERFNFKVVTEKTNSFQRKNFIKIATLSKSVTLFTAAFGRGTDFVVLDPAVQEKGVTVIQTFLSQEYSQQIQIKGRTARQGKVGTYELVLNQEQLFQKYKITKLMIEKVRQNETGLIKNFLHQTRIKYLQVKNSQRQKTVEKAKVSHESSMEIKKKLISGEALRNDPFFWKNRQYSMKREPIHFIFALDESGSMDNRKWNDLLTAVKQTMEKISAFSDTYVSIINFQSSARLIFERKNPKQIKVENINKIQGGTDFQRVFETVYNLAIKTINQQIIFFIFMTDGQAPYPHVGVNKFKNLIASHDKKFKYAGIQFQCSTDIMKQISKQLIGENLQANNLVQLLNAYDRCIDIVKYRSSPGK